MLFKNVITQSLRVAPTRASAARQAALRCYATAAATPDTKPPVALFGIDGTYASALSEEVVAKVKSYAERGIFYTAAVKTNSLDPTARALEALSKTFKSDAQLATILRAPSLKPADRDQIVEQLLKTSGAAGDKTVQGFLRTLAENNRLSALEGACDKFAVLMGAHRGEVELRVTSAAPLDQRVLRQLEQAVGKSAFVGQGKKLKVVPRVQPDIRGGLIVEIGDRTIDLSVSSKMARMNKLLSDTL